MSEFYYDNSLPIFVKFINDHLGDRVLEGNLFFRDASGQLSFLYLANKPNHEELQKVIVKAQIVLGNYADHEGFSITSPEELFDDDLADLDKATLLEVKYDDKDDEVIKKIYYRERRLVGSDWLRPDFSSNTKPVRIVFSSIKGGVGRSTALCVVAAALANEGKRVLTIDLDLEAPGIGNMLLHSDKLPEYGLLDYFVEKNLGNINKDFVLKMMGQSWLEAGKGQIDVIPVLGRMSLKYPENVLGKLSRAYLCHHDSSGVIRTFMDCFIQLLDEFCEKKYDAILIDARSGLHETTAVALLGLGAELYCFGANQPQTLSGYELLFSSISQYKRNIPSAWIGSLHFIHAKSSNNSIKNKIFCQKAADLIKKYFIYDACHICDGENKTLSNTASEAPRCDSITNKMQNNTICRTSALNQIISISDDPRFQDFDPIKDKDSLSERAYETTFHELIMRTKQILDNKEAEPS